MSITKTKFGTMPDGKEVYSYTLDNGKKLKAEILSYGATVRSLFVKDKDGNFKDVVLGLETLSDYLDNPAYYGAAVGRVANRVLKGTFELNGERYNLDINDGDNSLHGGFHGFSHYVWDVCEGGTDDEPELKMSILSPDGDGGYPGNLKMTVTYKLTAQNGLLIHYEGVSDKDTVVNMTNHSYFNLNGAGDDNIYSLDLQMNCDYFTPNTDECLPNGEILSVKNTPMDFTDGKKVGKDILSDFEQLKKFGGYDHNFAIRGRGFRKCAVVSSEKTGIKMEVYTNTPGVQLYTGNSIDEKRNCKNGIIYKPHDALCLETQYFPNSTGYSHFESPILKKDEKYDMTTEYRFI